MCVRSEGPGRTEERAVAQTLLVRLTSANFPPTCSALQLKSGLFSCVGYSFAILSASQIHLSILCDTCMIQTLCVSLLCANFPHPYTAVYVRLIVLFSSDCVKTPRMCVSKDSSCQTHATCANFPPLRWTTGLFFRFIQNLLMNLLHTSANNFL